MGSDRGGFVTDFQDCVLRFAICRNPLISFANDVEGACCILKPLKVQVYLDIHQWRKYWVVCKNCGMYPYLEIPYGSSKEEVITRCFRVVGRCNCAPDTCKCKGIFRASLTKLEDVFYDETSEDIHCAYAPLRFLWTERMVTIEEKKRIMEEDNYNAQDASRVSEEELVTRSNELVKEHSRLSVEKRNG